MPSMTITVTASEATRFQTAVGKVQKLGGPATAEQARQFIISRLKAFVFEIEREDYLAAHTDNPFDPT